MRKKVVFFSKRNLFIFSKNVFLVAVSFLRFFFKKKGFLVKGKVFFEKWILIKNRAFFHEFFLKRGFLRVGFVSSFFQMCFFSGIANVFAKFDEVLYEGKEGYKKKERTRALKKKKKLLANTIPFQN